LQINLLRSTEKGGKKKISEYHRSSALEMEKASAKTLNGKKEKEEYNKGKEGHSIISRESTRVSK